MFADEGEKVAAVVPKDKLHEIIALLPKLKSADDAVLADVVNGGDLRKAFGQCHCLLQHRHCPVTDIRSSSRLSRSLYSLSLMAMHYLTATVCCSFSAVFVCTLSYQISCPSRLDS